jgi:predicted LPLAT superfamily acyltransferase
LRAPRSNTWIAIAERGSLTLLFVLRRWYLTFGRASGVRWLTPIALYFQVTGRQIRRASRDYFRTLWATPAGRAALGRPPRVSDTYRQIREFSENLFDRMLMWSGEGERFHIVDRGREHLDRLVAEKRGGILLSSHVGSFDMLRVLSARAGITLNLLVFTEHAPRINQFFERLDPSSRTRLIHFDPSSIKATFQIKAAVERGEFVGILGDRVWQSPRNRAVSVDFLGRQARFPLGPFLLQAVLGCPMLLTHCVRTGAERYESTTELLAKAGVVPRDERDKHAAELAQRYATALEAACLRTPHQWFNFFEFWRGA